MPPRRKTAPKKRNYRKKRLATSKRAVSRQLVKVVETRKLCPEPADVKYDAAGTDQLGLSTTQSNNFILNPCNMEWYNTASGTAPIDGSQIFCRYLKQKLLFKFPEKEQMIKLPMRVQVVWGFIKLPLSYTEYTTPKKDEATHTNIIQKAFEQIEQEWDEADDQLKFPDKRPQIFSIVGRKWVKPDRRHRIGMPQAANWASAGEGGAPPDVKMTLSWPMNTKWTMERSTGMASTFRYNNQNYLPFTNIISYDFGNEEGSGSRTDAQRIQCRHASCLWYQDA